MAQQGEVAWCRFDCGARVLPDGTKILHENGRCPNNNGGVHRYQPVGMRKMLQELYWQRKCHRYPTNSHKTPRSNRSSSTAIVNSAPSAPDAQLNAMRVDRIRPQGNPSSEHKNDHQAIPYGNYRLYEFG